MTERSSQWPRVGASAAVLRGEEVLLVVRAKGALAGYWSLPGGHVEEGEPARAAAAREVREETGVVAELRGVLDVHDVIMRTDEGTLRSHYVLAVYWGEWIAGEPVAASDVRDARFHRLDALGGLDLTSGAAALARRAMALRAGAARRS
jgi:8-oxo-dGTP diphosphatase